jgi:hypothetical protein
MMTNTDILSLREQLQEDLMVWREINDLPEFFDTDLCELVLNSFSHFLEGVTVQQVAQHP